MRSLVIACLLVSGVAHAGKKNRKVALAASGIGTAASSLLVLSSFFAGDQQNPVNMPLLYAGLGSALVTPSLGEIYAGEYLTPGMGVRALAGGLAVYAALHTQQTVACDTGVGMCKTFTNDSIVLLGLAFIASIGGAAYDVMDAGDAVDRYNTRHGFAVTPTALAGPRGVVPGVYFSAAY